MNSTNSDSHVEPGSVLTALQKHILVDGFHVVMNLEKSHGCYIFDDVSKKELLDMYTSFSTLPVGYNHPKLLTEDFVKKILPAVVNKPANSDIYTVQYAEFVQRFSKTLPEALRHHLFFIESGGLAIENALKVAFDWKVRKNLASGKGEKGSKVIHFKECFHGRTGYTLSLTNTDPRKTMHFPKFSDWPRIPNPKLTFTRGEVTDEALRKVKELESEAVSQIEKALADYPDEIAALVIEPIQGEGGDNHFRSEFLRALRELSDKHGFLLIFDEVQTGFGTTGKWWCYEHFNVMPDILVFGKKTQVCGLACSRRVDDVDNVFKVSSRINSTWGGNLVDMIRCVRLIEIMVEENVVENASKVGEALLKGLAALEVKFPGKVSNVRGRGMFCAFDLPDTETRNKALKVMTENGLLCLTSGTRAIRLRPAPSLSMTEMEEALRIFDKSFTQLFA